MHVLFSTVPDDLGLYGKPMARNVQIWTDDVPSCCSTARTPRPRHQAGAADGRGGRAVRLPVPVPGHARRQARGLLAPAARGLSRRGRARPVVLPDAPLGYLTAYDADQPRPGPRRRTVAALLQRAPVLLAALAGEDYARKRQVPPHGRNVRKLLDAYALFGASRCRVNFARGVLGARPARRSTSWLARAAGAGGDPRAASSSSRCAAEPRPGRTRGRCPDSLTYAHTARRSFEVAYWKTIASLAEGRSSTRTTPTASSTRPRRRAAAPRPRPRSAWATTCSRYYAKAIAARGHDRQGAGRRPAVPLAHRLRLPVDGRLAEEPGRARPSATCSS